MILVQLNPKECLMVANDNSGEAIKLHRALKRSGVLVTERKRGEKKRGQFGEGREGMITTDYCIVFLAEFSAKDIPQDLNRLLKLDTGITSSALRKDDII